MKLYELSPLGQRAKGFRDFEQILDNEVVEVKAKLHTVERKKPESSLFDLVFAVNPDTGLPQGDIAVYMSKNTSPEVKRFIELNLHSPVGSSDASYSDFSNLSDDDIAFYTRGRDESVQSYRQRLYDNIKSLNKEKLDKNGEFSV